MNKSRIELLSIAVLKKNSDFVKYKLDFNGSQHELRTPNEAFFYQMGFTDNLSRYIFGHLGYFRPIYQHPFWYFESLVHFFN